MHLSYRTVEAHEALHKLYGSNYRVTEEVEIIQENLSKLRENRSRKISYIRNLRQHPEIYQPFFIIVTLRFRPFDFLVAIYHTTLPYFDKILYFCNTFFLYRVDRSFSTYLTGHNFGDPLIFKVRIF